ncbi:MAG: galactokinase [Bacteroidota bacterium]
MNKGLVNHVSQKFQQVFDQDPILVFSPGRINLIGEHTDYNDGFAFPAAVDKGIVLAIQKKQSGDSSVYALDQEERYDFGHEQLHPLISGGWRNYILGIVAELKIRGFSAGGFDAVFAGDIPMGAGMSSSAALENAFVFGLNYLFGLGLDRDEMILISQMAEHNYAKVKCGIMDQYASMFGVKNSALLLDCRSVSSRSFRIDLKDYGLLLINSNVKHDLSESAYNDRRAVCEKVSKLLHVKALRDVTLEDLEALKSKLSKRDFQKALYVLQENKRVIAFSESIVNTDLKELGKLLIESHEGLSKQYEVSCAELDFLVDSIQDNPNVLGGRMMGGGFGGCTINLVRKESIQELKEDVQRKFEIKFERKCSFYEVNLSQGTHLIN